MRLAHVLLILAAACAPLACGGSIPMGAVPQQLASLRADGKSSDDAEVLGRWALAEMFTPGGDTQNAESAKKRLDGLKGARGLYASLARGIYDEVHGDPRS